MAISRAHVQAASDSNGICHPRMSLAASGWPVGQAECMGVPASGTTPTKGVGLAGRRPAWPLWGAVPSACECVKGSSAELAPVAQSGRRSLTHPWVPFLPSGPHFVVTWPLHPMAPVPSGPASACRDLPHSAAAAEGSWTGPRISLANSHCSPTQQPRPQAEPRDGVHAGSGKVDLLQRGCPQVSGPRGQRRARLPCQATPLTTVSPLTPGQAISAPGWPSSGRRCRWLKVTRRAQVRCA